VATLVQNTVGGAC